MRISQRKFVWTGNVGRGNARWILPASVGLIVVLGIVIALQMRPAKVVAKRQASLIAGIEARSPARMQRLVSPGYSDRWGFTSDDIVETMADAGSQFLALVVTPEEQSIRIDEGRATVTAKLMISGKPVGPVGIEVTRQINQLAEPFVFVWEKQSFLPSSWRLVNVNNASLPDELYGYEPGDIRRAIRGE